MRSRSWQIYYDQTAVSLTSTSKVSCCCCSCYCCENLCVHSFGLTGLCFHVCAQVIVWPPDSYMKRKGTKYLARALISNTSLTSLNFGGKLSLFCLWSKFLILYCNLTDTCGVGIFGNRLFCWVAFSPFSHFLCSITDNEPWDNGAQSFAKVLKANCSLIRLNLSSKPLSVASESKFLFRIFKNLDH